MKLPDKHKIVEKGEHLFHSTYLGVEAVIGHGPLQVLAGLALLCIILDVLMHWLGD